VFILRLKCQCNFRRCSVDVNYTIQQHKKRNQSLYFPNILNPFPYLLLLVKVSSKEFQNINRNDDALREALTSLQQMLSGRVVIYAN